MSASTARALPVRPTVPAKQPERRLRPVTAPAVRRRPKLAYALVALAGAALIGGTQIGLSLAITQDSFALAGLTAERKELTLQSQALQEELAGLSSPQHLAANAQELGMVLTGTASYLRLSDGITFGSALSSGPASSINPLGAGAVGNELLIEDAPAASDSAGPGGADAPVAPVTPDLPPPLSDGLPIPTTR